MSISAGTSNVEYNKFIERRLKEYPDFRHLDREDKKAVQKQLMDEYPLTEFEKVEKKWNCPSQLDKDSSDLKTLISGANKKKTERMEKKFVSRLIDVEMMCHDRQGINRVARQAMMTDAQSLITDLQEVEQEVMGNTDMTADQQIDALRAEGLPVDMQLSEDMKIVVRLLSGMDIVTSQLITLRDCVRFTTLINTQPNEEVLLVAQTLSILYSGLSERKSKKLLRNLARIMNTEKITLPSMRKTLYTYSCICESVVKIVECPKCKKWVITSRVICPNCAAKCKNDCDWNECRLVECSGVNCGGNPTIFASYNNVMKKTTCCEHRCKKVKGRYTLFVPPESIIAEFIRSTLLDSMFGLEEKDIVDGVKVANVLGYHHLLYSENALDVYKQFGWNEAARAVEAFLGRMKTINDKEALNHIVMEAARIRQQKETCSGTLPSVATPGPVNATQQNSTVSNATPSVGPTLRSGRTRDYYDPIRNAADWTEADVKKYWSMISNEFYLKEYQTNWSMLWVSTFYHLLQDNSASQCQLPPPILNAALSVLRGMAKESATDSNAETADLLQVPRLPHLPAQKLNRNIRRRKGYKSSFSSRLSEDKDVNKIVSGAEEVKQLLFQFTASLDGVSVFANSITSNSVYVFSLLSENMARRHMVRGLDSFFLFVFSCSPSKPTADRKKDNRSNKIHDVRAKGKRGIISPSFRVKDDLSPINTAPEDACPGKNMANQDFHHILATVLDYMKEKGREGFAVRKGRVLYHIQYAITGVRADMPAGNFFLGFPGRHSSNQPCPHCKLVKRAYDPWMCLLHKRKDICVHEIADSMKTLMSSSICLRDGNPLRYLRTFLWMRNHPGSDKAFEESIHDEALKNYVQSPSFRDTKALLSSLSSLLPPMEEITLPDDTELYPGLPPYSQRQKKGISYSYDLSKYTYLSQEGAVGIDMMHMFHNLFDKLVGYLFEPIVDDLSRAITTAFGECSETKKKILVNTVLNDGKMKMRMTRSAINFISFDPSVQERARARFEAVPRWPDNIRGWIRGLFDGETKPIKGEEKISFCAAVLPYLFVDSMDDPKVWSIITLFAALNTMYNYDGAGLRLHSLQFLVQMCLSVLEMTTPPDFPTIYLHMVTHLALCYVTLGPLKGIDTLHSEGLYSGLKEQATGGSLPVQTMQSRKIIISSSDLLSFGLEDDDEAGVTKLEYGNLTLFKNHHGITLKWIHWMTGLNWASDSVHYANDLVPQLSFLDLQLNGWVRDYLNNTLRFGSDPAPPIYNYQPWDDETVKCVHDDVLKRGENKFKKYYCWKSLRWNGVSYGSLDVKPSQLTARSFKNGCFGMVYSLAKRSHFFLICGYVGAIYDGEFYLQALCYELPKYSVFDAVDDPFAFIVDVRALTTYDRQPLLISLHRLTVGELFIQELDENRVFCGVSMTCLREWRIIKRVMQKPVKSLEDELE